MPPAIQNPKSKIENNAGSTPDTRHPTLGPVPEIQNQKSKIKNAEENPERCHHCHSDLPPLLADGQRPSPFCWCCRTALHSPQNRHLYCPSCGCDLRIIIVNNQRTLPICPCCEVPLPPWPHQRSDPHASVLINAFVGGGSCFTRHVLARQNEVAAGSRFTFHPSVVSPSIQQSTNPPIH